MTSQELSRRRVMTLVADIGTMVDEYRQRVDRLADEGDYVALGVGLARFRALRRGAKDVETHAEDRLAKILPKSRLEEEGVTFKRHGGMNRSGWQSREIVRSLWTGAAADANGELDPEGQPERFLNRLLDALSSPQWKVTVLRELGYQVDEWVTETPARQTVEVWIPES